jgi:hypothetical protein
MCPHWCIQMVHIHDAETFHSAFVVPNVWEELQLVTTGLRIKRDMVLAEMVTPPLRPRSVNIAWSIRQVSQCRAKYIGYGMTGQLVAR